MTTLRKTHVLYKPFNGPLCFSSFPSLESDNVHFVFLIVLLIDWSLVAVKKVFKFGFNDVCTFQSNRFWQSPDFKLKTTFICICRRKDLHFLAVIKNIYSFRERK